MACLSRSDKDLFSGNKLTRRKNFASNELLVQSDRGTDEMNIRCKGPSQIYSLNNVCNKWEDESMPCTLQNGQELQLNPE